MHSKNWSMRGNIQPRRCIPKRKYKDYRQYKKWLRADFGYRCGYCSIHENANGGYWHFHVDHYKPKGNDNFKHLETEYANLLYSCDHCNILKGDIWVSDDPINDGIGWLDPCEHNLNEHYYYGYRDEEFTLVCLTKVGRWMSLKLALDQPARIRKHKYLAEEEMLDSELIECLKVIREQAIINGNQREEQETSNLILRCEERIQKRLTPAPFETLHRDKELVLVNGTQTINADSQHIHHDNDK
jgi:hypothetical protein